MIKVIAAWFQECFQLWTLCNQGRHGHYPATQLQAEAAQTIRELELFYTANTDNVAQRLRWIFDKPFEERRALHAGNIIRLWLNTWKPVVDESYKTDLNTG
jgi:hypothetical protein